MPSLLLTAEPLRNCGRRACRDRTPGHENGTARELSGGRDRAAHALAPAPAEWVRKVAVLPGEYPSHKVQAVGRSGQEHAWATCET